jgi:heme/copper-type cytochrome/quinol oxidase subunit 2
VKIASRLLLLATSLLLASCYYSNHNALHPAGLQAAQVRSLFWIFFGINALVWVAVLAFAAAAVLRSRRRGAAADETATNARMRRGIVIAVAR